jgi:hypothetical protein
MLALRGRAQRLGIERDRVRAPNCSKSAPLDATFNEAVTILGETGLTEVIGIIGYYTFTSNALNAFQVPVPE